MKKIFFIILLIIIWPQSVAALGVEINPSSLKLETNNKGEAQAVLTIANPSAEPGIFALSVDEQSNWFKIQPAELRLEAGERRNVKIDIKADRIGRYTTWLAVAGYPLDTRAFKAGSGVKVPVSLIVNEIKSYTFAYILSGAGFSLIVLGLFLLYYINKKNKG